MSGCEDRKIQEIAERVRKKKNTFIKYLLLAIIGSILAATPIMYVYGWMVGLVVLIVLLLIIVMILAALSIVFWFIFEEVADEQTVDLFERVLRKIF